MKVIQVIAKIVLDEKHKNAPTDSDVKLAIENALETPDNESFGIESVEVNVSSYLANYSGEK